MAAAWLLTLAIRVERERARREREPEDLAPVDAPRRLETAESINDAITGVWDATSGSAAVASEATQKDKEKERVEK